MNVIAHLCYAYQIQPETEELLTGIDDDDTHVYVGKLNFTVEYGLSSGLVRNKGSKKNLGFIEKVYSFLKIFLGF